LQKLYHSEKLLIFYFRLANADNISKNGFKTKLGKIPIANNTITPNEKNNFCNNDSDSISFWLLLVVKMIARSLNPATNNPKRPMETKMIDEIEI